MTRWAQVCNQRGTDVRLFIHWQDGFMWACSETRPHEDDAVPAVWTYSGTPCEELPDFEPSLEGKSLGAHSPYDLVELT
jgi:hypothetical protein